MKLAIGKEKQAIALALLLINHYPLPTSQPLANIYLAFGFELFSLSHYLVDATDHIESLLR